MTALAPHLSIYLREHLPRERAVSPHTVKTYANCFVLLVQFAADRLKRRPTDLEIEDLGTDMIMAFLDHVENGRGSWLAIRPDAQAAEIFLNASGQPMTRDGFAFRLAEHVKRAAEKQPSILGKRVTPHVLRHSCAMHTLAATGDIRKVALWLGHASIQSTETYLRADPEEKLQILAAHGAPAIRPGRFKPQSDDLLSMLQEIRAGGHVKI